jgi:hypothetical protein
METREEEQAVSTVTAGPSRPEGAAVQQGRVVGVHQADEHPGAAASQGAHGETGPFEEFPRRLEQQTLLGVHGQGFAGGDPERCGIEPVGADEEAALGRVAGAGPVGARGEERVEVPAAVVRHRHDGVAAAQDQLPELFRCFDTTW